MRAVVLLPLVAAVVAFVAPACADEAVDGCAETREPLDPLSIQHVIDPDLVTFLTDPPTSGPHTSGPAATGMLDAPLAAAAQVRVLESGGVVVQYREPLNPVDLRPLLGTNDGALVIAPGENLPAPIVATAWTWKLTCAQPDLDAITAFAQKRTVDAPGTD